MTPLLFGMRGEEEYRGFTFVAAISIKIWRKWLCKKIRNTSVQTKLTHIAVSNKCFYSYNKSNFDCRRLNKIILIFYK